MHSVDDQALGMFNRDYWVKDFKMKVNHIISAFQKLDII